MVRGHHEGGHHPISSLLAAASSAFRETGKLTVPVDGYGLLIMLTGVIVFGGVMTFVVYFAIRAKCHQPLESKIERRCRTASNMPGSSCQKRSLRAGSRASPSSQGDYARGDVESDPPGVRGNLQPHGDDESSESSEEDSSSDSAQGRERQASVSTAITDYIAVGKVMTRGGTERAVNDIIGGAGGELGKKLMKQHKKGALQSTAVPSRAQASASPWQKIQSIGGREHLTDSLYGGANSELRKAFNRVHAPSPPPEPAPRSG